MNIVRPTLLRHKTKCLQNIELMSEKAMRHQLEKTRDCNSPVIKETMNFMINFYLTTVHNNQ